MFDNGKKKQKKPHFLIVYKNELAYSRRVISIVDSFIHGRIYPTFVFVVLFFSRRMRFVTSVEKSSKPVRSSIHVEYVTKCSTKIVFFL